MTVLKLRGHTATQEADDRGEIPPRDFPAPSVSLCVMKIHSLRFACSLRSMICIVRKLKERENSEIIPI